MAESHKSSCNSMRHQECATLIDAAKRTMQMLPVDNWRREDLQGYLDRLTPEIQLTDLELKCEYIASAVHAEMKQLVKDSQARAREVSREKSSKNTAAWMIISVNTKAHTLQGED